MPLTLAGLPAGTASTRALVATTVGRARSNPARYRASRWSGLAERKRSARAPDSIWRRRTWEPAKLLTTRTSGFACWKASAASVRASRREAAAKTWRSWVGTGLQAVRRRSATSAWKGRVARVRVFSKKLFGFRGASFGAVWGVGEVGVDTRPGSRPGQARRGNGGWD